jgi:hypothetical protein
MDLFTPIVEDDLFHQHFKNILLEKDTHSMKVISDWAEGFVDRDGKFVKEFQTTFNSSFWELYLYAMLKELNYAVDLRYPSPDFVITNEKNKVCIEATTSSNALGFTPEWEGNIKDIGEADKLKIIEHSSIRLANALISKSRKYEKSYQKLSHVKGKPFVL